MAAAPDQDPVEERDGGVHAGEHERRDDEEHRRHLEGFGEVVPDAGGTAEPGEFGGEEGGPESEAGHGEEERYGGDPHEPGDGVEGEPERVEEGGRGSGGEGPGQGGSRRGCH